MTETLDKTLDEFEMMFDLEDDDPKCLGIKLDMECNKKATWAMVVTCCGSSFQFCNECKRACEMWILLTKINGGFNCRTCHAEDPKVRWVKI